MRYALLFTLALLGTTACSRDAEGGACVPVLYGWTTPEGGQPVHHIENTVSLDGHQILWNGVKVSENQLVRYVRQVAKEDPLAFIIFDPAKGECDFAKSVRDRLDENYPCSGGACGQGAREDFKNAPFKEGDGPPA